MIAALLLIFPLVFGVVAWIVMLLVDPATAGVYTISYGQALAITALASLLFGGSYANKD